MGLGLLGHPVLVNCPLLLELLSSGRVLPRGELRLLSFYLSYTRVLVFYAQSAQSSFTSLSVSSCGAVPTTWTGTESDTNFTGSTYPGPCGIRGGRTFC